MESRRQVKIVRGPECLPEGQKEAGQKRKRCCVCGEWFYLKIKTQKYCSKPCQRYANRHGGKTYDGTPLLFDPRKEIIREFRCRQCGKLVRVTEDHDLRTKFCSQECENRYWKHSRKKTAPLVERVFQCKSCGKLVRVTSPKDRRTVFCSRICSMHYFSRPRGWISPGTDLLQADRCQLNEQEI